MMELLGWQWHQLDHMQTNCTSIQTDNHTNTSSVITQFFTGRMLFLTRNQQRRQSTNPQQIEVNGVAG